MAGKSIETGVDKLVELINLKKKVELQTAAKELGVAVPVVQEWANFLEEEGVITIEDNLRKTFLSERKLSKVEVEKKTQEYSSKKDAFVRKVENAAANLDKESEDLELVRKEFERLKDLLGKDLQAVEADVKELRHYEDLKKSMDKEIMQQRSDYQIMIENVHRKVLDEKKLFDNLIADIDGEKKRIEDGKIELTYLEKKEDVLQKRIEALKEIIVTIDNQIEEEKIKVNESIAIIDLKVKKLDQLKNSILAKVDSELGPIVQKTKGDQDKVIAAQDHLLQKMFEKKKQIDKYEIESSEAAEKFKQFYDSRVKTEEIILKLEKDKRYLQTEMNELIAKAKTFNLSIKSSDMKEYVKELEDKLNKIGEKRKTFVETLKELTSSINNKGA